MDTEGSALDRLVNMIIENGIIVYPASPALSVDGWPAPMRIYVGGPPQSGECADKQPEDDTPAGEIGGIGA